MKVPPDDARIDELGYFDADDEEPTMVGPEPDMAIVPVSPPPKAHLQPQPPQPQAVHAGPHITRSRAYRFILDESKQPIELGSGRFAKAYLGEEVWLESKTAFRRRVAIKILQRNVSEEDALRFQMEKELLERVQGHPNIIAVHASGESDNPEFIPAAIRERVENDFMIIELCDVSLEERLKGARGRGQREDLLLLPMRERLFRVLEYVIPITAAVEYAHLVRHVCHRDIKPANILIKLPNQQLRGDTMDVRLADFNVGKVRDEAADLSVTRLHGVPGTLFFQAPEQETNVFELLVNVQRGQREIEYFEDFYIDITQNDTFQLFNRPERYPIQGADRSRKRIILARPWQEPSESNVRAKIIKSVDRPADIYSLGATFYYLITGAYGNPKNLYDAFHKFIEYDGDDEQNTIEGYIEHEYAIIQNLRAPKVEGDEKKPVVAPANRFFTYKHYLDGNGELIDKQIMKIVARAMIRNKPDSYCQSWDIHTVGISDLVEDLRHLYEVLGMTVPLRPGLVSRSFTARPTLMHRLRRFFRRFRGRFEKLELPRLPGPKKDRDG